MKVRIFLFIIVVICCSACCKKEMSPEERIRAQIEEIKEYANKRQVGKIMEYISPDYRDGYGNRRDSLKAILIQNLMFRKNVRVFLKDVSVKITDKNADVQLSVFVKEGEGVIPDNADAIKIELRLVETGDKFLITSAQWKSGASPF